MLVCLLCCAITLPAQPVTQDINAGYKSRDLDIQVWVDRFEVEGREVFDNRDVILAALGLQPGQVVADVGAGTGLFIPLLADRVGTSGTVYAVDIAPAFIEHIQKRVRERGLTQVKTVLNGEKSVDLSDNSIDVVFTCDVYHHFVYYQEMLASIHSALRPDGRFVVVDYDKVPGKSSDFIMQHIRDTKEVFTREIEAAGFSMSEEVTIPGFRETFMRVFVKRGTQQ
jgi:ubiquinone/menaquinone biosynthesis C-methylase UbiE